MRMEKTREENGDEKMNDSKQIGANIRSLRRAYGETLEQLANVIEVGKGLISEYEHGVKMPNRDKLCEIAKHYNTPVDVILHSDLTGLEEHPITINIDKLDMLYKTIFPIASSNEALCDELFKRAFKSQMRIYVHVQSGKIDRDIIDRCFCDYLDVDKNRDIGTMAVANILALWHLLMAFRASMLWLNERIALPRGIVSESKKLEKEYRLDFEKIDIITNLGSISEIMESSDLIEFLNELDEEEMRTAMTKLILRLKGSKEWSDLADYYLALQYIYNIVDNGLERGLNQCIGIEMMSSFESMNNPYAKRFDEVVSKLLK